MSGVLIGTSYIPLPPWALLFCYIPLWTEVVRNEESFQQSFFRGWITQFVLSLIGFHWIAYVSYVYGYLPWPIAGLALLLFSAFVHLYIPFATGLAQVLRNKLKLRPLTTFLLLAGLTSLGEIFWPSMFPWNLGYTLYWVKSPVAQNADTIGFLGLSFLILIMNAILAWALFTRKAKNMLAGVFLVFFTFLFLHFTGVNKQEVWSRVDRNLRVLQVQANIGNFEKIMAERGEGSQDFIVNQHFDLTRKGLHDFGQADLIVWPETAFPAFLNPTELNRDYQKQFASFLKEVNTPILTGAYSRELSGSEAKNYNGLFLYREDTSLSGSYHKTNLLVFGEYTPLSSIFPWLTKISPAGEGWAKGTGPKVIPFREAQIGPQICYESLYPEFSAKLVSAGAQWIVNLTNDSWFGPTFEPHQHMIMTLARAIENRRPLIRSTNTGITTAALADGTILKKSDLYQAWYGMFHIGYQRTEELTFYTKYHSWLPLFVFFILLLSVGLDRFFFRGQK